MKNNLIKLTILILFAAVGVIVLFPAAHGGKSVFAKSISAMALPVLDSRDIPTGAKAKLTLGKDATKEYGEVVFDHDTHSFNKYSPDGKSDIACIECHHTDQPKSSLKAPLITSERNEVLTADALKKAGAKEVKSCRSCHFQEGNIPDGKEQAVLGTGDNAKEINNEIAYHRNCNVCHDEAVRMRPQLKGKKGFATSDKQECFVCHKKQ